MTGLEMHHLRATGVYPHLNHPQTNGVHLHHLRTTGAHLLHHLWTIGVHLLRHLQTTGAYNRLRLTGTVERNQQRQVKMRQQKANLLHRRRTTLGGLVRQRRLWTIFGGQLLQRPILGIQRQHRRDRQIIKT